MTIGRFQVMALLQAARYYLLKGDLERAKSFGLNRAIFYAWAKRTGGRRHRSAGASHYSRVPSKSERVESLGDERAYVSPTGLFVIGDQVQRPQDYDRQVVRRIEKYVPYEVAWEAALKYLSTFPKSVLLSQREFYEKVYKPVRDNFEEVIRRYSRQSSLPS